MPVDRDAAGVDLNLAARSGDIDVVRSQLRRPGTDLETRDILGDTGLLKASRYGHAEVVKELLVAGADVNAQDSSGWSSLHTSIANNREDVFFALLSGKHGAAPIDIEAVTSSGDTCLHMAAFHGREWAIDTLLRLGSDRDATNGEGKRPVEVARLNAVRTILQQPSKTLHDKINQSGAGFFADREWAGGAAGGDSQQGPNSRRDKKKRLRTDESTGIGPGLGGGTQEEEDAGTGNNKGRTSPNFGPPLGEADYSRPLRGLSDGDKRGVALPLMGDGSAGVARDDLKLDSLFNGSLVSSLVSTVPEGDGSASLEHGGACDPFFEEGSSEEESSQESGDGLR